MSFVYNPEKAKGFTAVPEGEYELFVKGFELRTSQNSGNPYYNVVLVIRDDVDQEGKGQNIWDVFSLSEAAEFKFHNLLSAFTIEKGTSFPDKKAVLEFAKGKAVRAKIGKRTYQGKDQNEIKSYLPSQVGGEMKIEETPQLATAGQPVDISEDDIMPF